MADERLIRFLGKLKAPSERYAHKLEMFDVPDRTELWDVLGDEKFRQALRDAGLKKGQRAGVTRIISEVGYIVDRDSEGTVNDTYQVTVGDVRKLSDEQLAKLTSQSGVDVLRALFGSTPQGE